jgi:DNA repair exonuclease SbcCD ATPase subunit
LEFRKRGIVGGIQSVDEQLMDSSKVNDAIFSEKDKLYSLKDKLRGIECNAKIEAEKPMMQLKENIYNIHDQKVKIDRELKQVESEISFKTATIKDYKNQMDGLKDDFKKISTENFELPEDQTICPLCKRPFDEEHIDQTRIMLQENFNLNQAEKKKKINEKGKAMKSKVEVLNKEIEELNEKSMLLNAQALEIIADLNDTETKYKNFKPEIDLESNSEYQELKIKIEQLELNLSQPKELNNQVNDLKERKRKLEEELEEINTQLSYKEQNEKLRERIKELTDKESAIAQQIAELEGQEFLCEKFIKTKVELLENSINDKFKFVSFKLFNTLVNGAVEECCEALIKGVPFSNANKASQINAGLDIINALCSHYGVQAPIFIDNRESVNDIIDTDSQIVNLVVTKEDEKLRISTNKESEVA